jgi:hypothetical protein
LARQLSLRRAPLLPRGSHARQENGRSVISIWAAFERHAGECVLFQAQLTSVEAILFLLAKKLGVALLFSRHVRASAEFVSHPFFLRNDG